MKRCKWVPEGDELYIEYHDKEWGVPVHKDNKHFEFLILEGAQAGLSWRTVLKRREGYKKAFSNFDPKKVAKYDDKKIEKLLENPEIIRNRLKVASAVSNAKVFLQIQKEFGSFDKYIWGFVDNKTINNKIKKVGDYVVYSKEAEKLSKDLKTRGFKFVGPTVIYAHMQACGLVNDHMIDCFRYKL